MANNIKWIGEDGPCSRYNIGMTAIDLPDADIQREGFYLPEYTAQALADSVKGYELIGREK